VHAPIEHLQASLPAECTPPQKPQTQLRIPHLASAQFAPVPRITHADRSGLMK